MISKKDLELLNSLKTSYKQENLGWTFYALIQSLIKKENPICVELGCLEGYSTSFIAHSLNDLDKGHLWVVDYFSDPKLSKNWTHSQSTAPQVQEILCQQKINHRATLLNGDAFVGPKDWITLKDKNIDFLHIDLGNTYDVLNKIFSAWRPFFSKDIVIVIEGGSNERDYVNWMKPKDSIRDWLLEQISDKWNYSVIGEIPSLTILRRKLI